MKQTSHFPFPFFIVWPKTAAANLRFSKETLLDEAKQVITRRYGLFYAVLALAVIFLVTFEHSHSDRPENLAFVLEILFVAVLFSALSFMTRVMLAALAEKSRTLNTLRIQHNLSLSLASTTDITEMTRRLFQQIALVVPITGAQLYLYERNKSWFIQVDTGPGDGAAPAVKKDDFLHGIDPYPCRNCLAQTRPNLRPIKTCSQSACLLYIQTRNGYCLPLAHENEPVGLLHIYADAHQDLTGEEKALLKNLAAEMSCSLSAALKKKAREEELLAQSVRKVQQDIARDLHDTIGQNISYLRLKLDLLSGANLKTKVDAEAEIQHMSDVANESYDLVRGTLSVLQNGGSTDLRKLFTVYAEQIAERAAFNFVLNTQGTAHPLTSNQTRQLFYIFREALSNIEKHAHATQVWVELVWEADSLGLFITDNGQGFDPSQTPSDHYGLKFMRDRTEQINGSFSVLSNLGLGTNIVIHMQYG